MITIARTALAVAFSGIVLGLAAACSTSEPDAPADTRPAVQKLYPDLAALYGAPQGIYQGCAPTNGVCHQGKEFPQLGSLGAIAGNIDLRCNRAAEDPRKIDDRCEGVGDRVTFGDGDPGIEIAWIEADETGGARDRFLIHLRSRAERFDPFTMRIVRDGVAVHDVAFSAAKPPELDPSGTIVVATKSESSFVTMADLELSDGLAGAGRAGASINVRVGDPNRNGIYGAELGTRLIKPGDPAHSYLWIRLTDPSAGPLMPRANCCQWTKTSLRALYCWIAGLSLDGSNAFAAIDYEHCPESPENDLLAYPEPGPECDTRGMCPIKPRPAVRDEPTWDNLYTNLFAPRCGGARCHGSGVGGLTIGEDRAATFASVTARVVPGNPSASRLLRRVDPALCNGACRTMPLGEEPLPPRIRELVTQWIASGAAP
jgi:hypothetical protein